MSYYFAKSLTLNFADTIERVKAVLAEEGFGIVSDIDVSRTFRDKLGKDFRQYRILGACNPQMAYDALTIDDKVGTMLPCNVIVQESGAGRTEVAAIDPVASMLAIENATLASTASEVRRRLAKVVELL